VQIFSAKFLVDCDSKPIDRGGLLIDQGQILALGTLKELKKQAPSAEVYDFGESVILPLFVNAHTHLELSSFPDWARAANASFTGQDFVDWILNLIAIKRQIKTPQVAASLAHGINLAINSGTGVIADILSYPELHNHYRDRLINGFCFLETLGQSPEIINSSRLQLQRVLAEFDAGLVNRGLSPHSPYTLSAEYLSAIYQWCRADGLRCSTHLAESEEEVDFICNGKGAFIDKFYPSIGWEKFIPQGTGLSPAEYLQRQGGLFSHNLLVHGVHLSAKDIQLLADNHMFLAFCPRSNATLHVGKAPAAALIKAGVQLALGTDSLASNSSLSLWDEMAFAHSWFEGALDAPTLLYMATLGGAKALGLEANHGSLATGKRADFQIVELPQGLAKNELLDYFVALDCDKSIKQVYHQGEAMLPPVSI
jgi:cytosine/adenosine deaminase-related metal-dependent hydrolase